MKDLLRRVLIATPFVLVYSYALLSSSDLAKYIFLALFVLFILMGAMELSSLINTSPLVSFLGAASGVILFLFFFPDVSKSYFYITVSKWWLLVALLIPTLIPAFFMGSPYSMMSSFSGYATSFFYLGVFPSFLLALRFYSPLYLLVVTFTVWLGDSAAYFLGTKFGRRRLIPHISPNKSWVGFWANLVFSIAFFVLAFYFLVSKDVALSRTSLAALFLSLIAQLGDLLESSFKRVAGRKDSGFLPGHGGVLDALDALVFVAPVSFIIKCLLGI